MRKLKVDQSDIALLMTMGEEMPVRFFFDTATGETVQFELDIEPI